MTVKNIDPKIKSSIIEATEKIINEFGIEESRLVIKHYFSNYEELKKKENEIKELEQQIESIKSSM